MKYRLQDLIDMAQFQALQDRLNEIYPFPSAIVDNDGTILTATAWQDICTQFHRQHTECEKECIKSDQYILSHIAEANPAVSYRCPHGLVDNATPIIIDGVHVGNFFTGQFFLDDPDLAFFRAQAIRYGFDETAYLAAVRKVPIWTSEKLNSYLFFIKGLIEVIAGIGLKNLRTMEAKQKMEESEQALQAMFEMASVGIAQADPHTGKWVRVNQKLCAITGYPAEEMLALRVPEITHPDDRARDWEAFQRVVRGEAPYYRLEKRYLRKDGTVVWVNVNMTVLRDPAGQPVRTMATIEDITERKEAEQALRDSEQRHRTVLQTALDGFWIADMQGRLLEVNAAYCRMSGYSAPELLALRIPDLEAAESADDTAAHIQKVLAQGEDRFESRHRRKDGSDIDVEISVQYRPTEGGRMVAFLRDISARKQAEAEKAKLQDQLLQSQKMESVGRLAGGVAHDFNNMLSVILGHVELALLQVEPTQPLHADLQEIRTAADRSADLTRQLLAFARKQTIAPRVLDLNVIVEGILAMLRRLIGENIDLAWLPGAGLWPVEADPSQIGQILANLCVNARDAIADVGTVTIRTGNRTIDEAYCADHADFVPGDFVQLTVSDTGCGMDQETLVHLFEPFFTTKGVGKGTGLGLATVYGVVAQNSGFLTVSSEPGRGATFTIYLPRHVGTTGQLRTTAPGKPAGRGHETILLVEDEPAILSMTTRVLERQGHIVLAARTPGEALRLAREHPGDLHLLLTDVVMPEMNGRELAKNLLALHPTLKRLFMSGYTADVIAHHGVLEEGVHFIQKPFSLQILAAKVREALENRGKGS